METECYEEDSESILTALPPLAIVKELGRQQVSKPNIRCHSVYVNKHCSCDYTSLKTIIQVMYQVEKLPCC